MPPRLFDVRQFGAAGDGKKPDTEAIQQALNACAPKQGGGTVTFPPGIYLSQPLYLKGNGLTVRLEAGAKLQATDRFEDFAAPDQHGVVALLNATGLNDLTVSGKGVIDGAGAKWWPGVKLAKVNGTAEPRRRPRLVVLQKCRHLRVTGLTLQNSPSFHLVPVDCEDVVVEDVTIRAPAGSPTPTPLIRVPAGILFTGIARLMWATITLPSNPAGWTKPIPGRRRMIYLSKTALSWPDTA